MVFTAHCPIHGLVNLVPFPGAELHYGCCRCFDAGGTERARTKKEKAVKQRQQYEYRVLHGLEDHWQLNDEEMEDLVHSGKTTLEEVLSIVGKRGWRLVQIFDAKDGRGYRVIMERSL